MKNILFKLSIFLLVIVGLMGVVSCNEENTNALNVKATEYTYETKTFNTIHQFNYEDTNDYFVLNGTTDYKIVCDTTDNSKYGNFAKTELHDFIKEATGIDMEIINDSESLSNNGKYLYLGETINAKNLGYVTEAKALDNTSAYIIKSNGNATYLVGASKFGTLYAVYTFLNMYFNYQIIAIDEIILDRDIDKVIYKKMNVKDVPDFEYRQTTHGEENYDSAFQMRMRMQTEDDLIIPLNGETFHNWLNIIPYATYGKSHPEWFNSAKSNLNLVVTSTVAGKKVSVINEALLNQVFENIKPCILAYPEGTILGFTQEDGSAWGDNDASNLNYSTYGVHSVESAMFTSRLATLIGNWLTTEHPELDIVVFDFAYSHTMEAPVYKLDDGSFLIMDESCKLPSNAAILFCSFKSNDYYPFEAEINSLTTENIQKWQLVAENLFSWNYYTNFNNFALPVDCFTSLPINNKYLYDNNVIYLYNQFGHTQPMGSDWYRLKEYLSARLSWNCQEDVQTIYNDFFTNYFKDAASIMYRFFEEERAWFKHLADLDSNLVMLRKNNNFAKEYWPSAMLKSWLGLFEEAYQSIAYLKTADFALYEKLYDRICAESITVRYLYYKLHKTEMTDELYNSIRTGVIADCNRVGFTRGSEGNYTLSDF